MASTPKGSVFLADSQSRKPAWIWALAVLLCIAWSVAAIAGFPWLDRLDMAFFDTLARMDRHEPGKSHVVLVDVDESSLAAVGQWPWPRYRLAAMVKALASAGPRAIVLDFFFPEPDRTSLSIIQDAFRREFALDLTFEGVPESMVDNDAYFGHVLANAPSVGAFVLLDGPAAESPYCGIPSLSIQGNPEGVNPAAFEGVLCSTPPVQAGFARCGFINVKKDPDGLLRRLPLLARHGEKWCPSIGLAALLAADPRAALEFERDAWGPVLRVGDSRVPMDQHARVLLRFARTLNAIPVLSAVDILAGRLDPEAVRDRLVLIGSSASGLGDLHRTAVLPVLPGIAAHAVLLENIASGSHYRQPEWKRTYAMIVTLLAATAVLGFFLLTGAGTATVGICTTLVLFPAIGAMSFLFNGIVLPAVAPVIAALSLLVFLTGSFYAVEKRLARARGLRMVLLKQAMLELMVDLAESRDLETGEHIKRTQLLVKVLAEGLAAGGKYPGLNAYVIELLYTCAPLHDVGKIVVPDRILRKPGPLDEEEFALMQEHVVYGERIIEMLAQRVQGDEVLDFALALVATHHENWDGTGYPEGLAGEEIPLSGRIMALADVYDALTSERVYKERLSHAEARKIIVSETGTKFDPEVVRAFLAQEDKIKALLGRSDHPADNPRVSNPV